jgi:L-rhamnose isomerase
MGAAVDPIAAFKQSGYAERVAKERAEGVGAGWG